MFTWITNKVRNWHERNIHQTLVDFDTSLLYDLDEDALQELMDWIVGVELDDNTSNDLRGRASKVRQKICEELDRRQYNRTRVTRPGRVHETTVRI